MDIRCEGRIERVVVHARGALVTRRVDLPESLPDGDLDVVVHGLTLLAWPGSLRAAVKSASRGIVFARLGVHIPAVEAARGRSVEAVRALEQKSGRLRNEQAALEQRRERLGDLQPRPSSRSMTFAADVQGRIGDGLACAGLVREELAAVDERLLALGRELEKVDLERAAARLEDAQTSSASRRGAGVPTRVATIRLTGAGAVESLELTYAVPGARWWPTSTLRLSDGGAKAAWTLEALVAQATGEDWRGCRLGLSTADLHLDARLPELASLRFGRAQARPRTGYRPPPPGLAGLFAEFDAAFPSGLSGQGAPPPPPAPALSAFGGLAGGAAAAPAMMAPPPPPMPRPMAAPSMAAPRGARDEASMDLALAESEDLADGAPAEEAQPMPKADRAELKKSKSMARMAPGAAPMMNAATLMLGGGGTVLRRPQVPAPEPQELEPGAGWLDFDALSLQGPEDRGRRGRLVQSASDPFLPFRSQAEQRLEAVEPGVQLRDPIHSRGHFDHRYDAEGKVDVPADGVVHRVSLGRAAAAPALRLRAVPLKAPEVYREATLVNPFDAPLLAGPVDVYVEGSLLSTSQVAGIDKGGTMTVGMGVEDRVRIARNLRVDEASSGVFGGSLSVTHSVSFDLTSSLGREVVVEVVDRVPVTDKKAEVAIDRLGETPPSEEYKQVDRGAPIRGGRLWRVTVPAGGKARIEAAYRLVLSAKDEVVGGNRRE